MLDLRLLRHEDMQSSRSYGTINLGKTYNFPPQKILPYCGEEAYVLN
jgi:hypothetical protein